MSVRAAVWIGALVASAPPAFAQPILALRCRAKAARFLDGFVFPSFDVPVRINTSDGWSSDDEQVWKRFPDGVTVIIARDSGRYEKYDALSHLQVGRCKTIPRPGSFVFTLPLPDGD